MHSSSLILVAFALFCWVQADHYSLSQNYVDDLMPLPKSFSEADRRAVQEAMEASLDCDDFNPNWNATLRFEINDNDFPNCISLATINLQKRSCSKIPKIIHQQWMTKELPAEWLQYHLEWKQKNPDWVVLLWSDEDEIEFLREHFGWFVDTFQNFPYDVERADAFRYILMWVYGGVYVDIDYECKRPLSEYIASIRKPIGLVSPKNGGFSNSMLLSVPNHEFWRNTIEQLYLEPSYNLALTKHEHVIQTTGPKFINRLIDNTPQYDNDICALQKELFHPCSFCMSDEECNHACEECYASHHYAKSWNDWSSSITNFQKCSSPPAEVFELTVPLCLLGLLLCFKKRWYRPKKIAHRKLIEDSC